MTHASECIHATYWLETPIEPARAAETIAGEQCQQHLSGAGPGAGQRDRRAQGRHLCSRRAPDGVRPQRPAQPARALQRRCPLHPVRAGAVLEDRTGSAQALQDDELQAAGPHCPFEDRGRAVMHEVHASADRPGSKVMGVFSLTGEIDEMKRHHDFVHAQGGTCVMLSLNSVGLSGLHELRRHSTLPIHAHRNGNKFRESGDQDQVRASVQTATEPLWSQTPMHVMPVFCSGQTGLAAAAGSRDLIFAAGGGIFDHPAGVPLVQHAAAHSELQQARGFW